MKCQSHARVLICAVMLWMINAATAQPPAPAIQRPADHDPSTLLIIVAPGVMMAPFELRDGQAARPGAEQAAAAALIEAGVIECGLLFEPPLGDPQLAAHLRMDRMYLVRLRKGADVKSAATQLAGRKELYERVSLNPVVRGDATLANDPYFQQGVQWPLWNVGLTGQIAGPDISATMAWDIERGSSAVRIAILDSGINGPHPDLAGKVVAGRNFMDPLHPTNAWADDNSHGSHCAGIAAANSNNALGIAGVCWGCSLMAVKILDSELWGNTGRSAAAIRWAADNGASVISMSYSGETLTAEEQAAVEYAYGRGVVLVTSSGNDNSSVPRYPGAFSQCIRVGSTNRGDDRSPFSNFGSTLDVVAPGSDVASTVLGSGFDLKSGTSMAAPHVSGLAGLIRSISPYSPGDVRAMIEDGCDDLGSSGWDQYFGYGRINAYRSLQLASRGVWVDFSYVGTERGVYQQPYNTLSEGLGATPTGGELNIKPGTQAAGVLFDRAMYIRAPRGGVTIGQ
ncbi:MAG: S8 family serine peptidase [Planctomycetes bacterium]|nr:S8 family serine peptidase [Planctomycetota bacterium]